MPSPRKTDAELSEAARAVVRDTGDPRIDAHLAAMGLGPDNTAAPNAAADRAQAADRADAEAALHELRGLRDDLAAQHRRVRLLAIALAVAVLVDVLLGARLILA